MQPKIWRTALVFAVLSPLTVGVALGQDKAPTSAPPPVQATAPSKPVMERIFLI